MSAPDPAKLLRVKEGAALYRVKIDGELVREEHEDVEAVARIRYVHLVDGALLEPLEAEASGG